MKAVVVTTNGGPENMQLTDREVPVPGPDQVAVAVITAGVNYLDIYQRNGAVPAPFTAGVDSDSSLL